MADNETKMGREILADARQKASHTLEKARREAEKLLQSVRDRQLALRREKMEAAEQAATEKARNILAVLDVEKRRQILLSREKIVRAVLDKAAAAVNGGEDYDRNKSLLELLREAAAGIGSGDLIVRMRPADAALLGAPAVVETVLRYADAGARAALVEDPAVPGGVIVETADGKRRFDNSLPARRRRLEKTLRPRIARELGFEQGTP